MGFGSSIIPHVSWFSHEFNESVIHLHKKIYRSLQKRWKSNGWVRLEFNKIEIESYRFEKTILNEDGMPAYIIYIIQYTQYRLW